MENVNSYRITKKNLFILSVVITISVLFQVLLLNRLSYSLPLIIVINALLFSFIIYLFLLRQYLSIILIVLSLVPLIYLDLPFHYSFITIIIQDLPIIFLAVITLISLLANIKSTEYSLSGLATAILLLTLYSVVMLVLGIKDGNPKYYIFEELYHVLYYSLFFIYLNSLKTRREFKIVLFAILFIAIIFAFEFIYYNIFGRYNRFVTFQAYILPLIGSISFALFLFQKGDRKNRMLFGIISFIIQFGIFITLTRTLWAASFITLSVLFAVYLWKEIGFSKITIFILFIILTIPLVYLGTQIKPQRQSERNTDDVEYRSQSLANPGEDRSFLMRVELGLYILEDFVESPIVGHGFGASVKYKYLGITNKPIYYPDNSWLFFLWKGGIIGFILFFIVYFKSIKMSWTNFKNTDNVFVRGMMIGIFSGLVGLMLFGFFNAVLIKYKTTLVLPFFLAYIEFENRNLLKSNNNS